MTWEQGSSRSDRRRWLLPTLVAAVVVAVAAVAVAARDAPDAPPSDSLAIEPPPGTDATEDPTARPVDPADFEPEPLAPMETTTEVAGDGPPLPDGPRDFTLIATDHLGMWTVDMASGRTERHRMPGGAMGSFPGPLLVDDDDVVFSTDASVVRVAEDRRRPLRIARRRVTIPTLDDDAVWVVDARMALATDAATRVRLDGQILDHVEMPAMAVPFHGTADQLLVSAPGIIARIGTDGSRSLVARGDPVASNGTQLAWLQCAGDLSCDLVVGSVDEPDGVRVRLPSDELLFPTFGFGGGVFSPDGRWLAIVAFQAAAQTSVISFVDVITGVEVHRAPGPTADAFGTAVTWSPDSEWAIFTSPSGISAWRAGTRETTALDVGFGTVRGLAVRPSSN